jgi:hypothetical protein
MMWSLLYSLTRNTLSVMMLRIGGTAKDIQLLVLCHQLAGAAAAGEPSCPRTR